MKTRCKNTDNQCVCGRDEGSGNSCYFATQKEMIFDAPIIDHGSTGKPDCCGCWVWRFSKTSSYYVKIVCNECGEERVLIEKSEQVADISSDGRVPIGSKFAVKIEAWSKLVDVKLDLERRVESHIKGEGCKYFCPDCDKPSWFVDDEEMTCLFCGHKGFPVPDMDAEQTA